MKVVFAGTPGFARVALQRLLDAGFSLPLVLTRPDQPAGRGLQWQASPVKQCALAHGLAVAQPRSLRLDGRYPQDAAAGRAAVLGAPARGGGGGWMADAGKRVGGAGLRGWPRRPR